MADVDSGVVCWVNADLVTHIVSSVNNRLMVVLIRDICFSFVLEFRIKG